MMFGRQSKKIKENEEDKYLDLAGGLKKLRKTKVTVILIAINALGTTTKFAESGLDELDSDDVLRPFQLRHRSDRSEYWEELWRLEEICWHSDFSERLSANVSLEKKKNTREVITRRIRFFRSEVFVRTGELKNIESNNFQSNLRLNISVAFVF